MYFVEKSELIEKELIAGFHGKAINTGSMTLMYWTVDEGAAIPMHQHIHEQVAHVLSGSFELTVGGETRVLQEGTIAVIPSNVPHGGRAITHCQLLDVFAPEREEYKF